MKQPVQKPAPAGKPKAKPSPLRPPQRTTPLPRTVDLPDAGGFIGSTAVRSISRVLGGAVGALFADSKPLNLGEQDALDKYYLDRQISTSIGDFTSYGWEGGEAIIVPGKPMPSPAYSLHPRGWPGSPDALPGYGPSLPARLPQNHPLRRLEPDEYGPGYDPDPYESPRAKNPLSRAGNPSPISRPDVSRAPGAGLPGIPGKIALPAQPGLIVGVETLPNGEVRFRVRPVARRDASLSRPRYGDSKAGKRLVGVLNYLVTATYGVVSELEDAAEIFANNTYALHRGRVVSALDLEGGSLLGTLSGYARGEYRTDVVGFAVDFAINQASDYAYAKASQVQMGLATRLAGEAGYKANRSIEWGQRVRGDQHVLSPVIRDASRWLRSRDAQRSSRVRSLW